MKETQRLLMVNLDHDYDLDNARFAGAYENLEKICASMSDEMGVDIDLEIHHEVVESGGACCRRNTQVFMIIDTMALGVIKLGTGQDILYSEGIVHRNDGWNFLWSRRPHKHRVKTQEHA